MDFYRSSVLFILIVCSNVFFICGENLSDECYNVSRRGWGGKRSLISQYMIKPVQYVVIQHTATPGCNKMRDCAKRVANIQSYHMKQLKYSDIGANFLVGGDDNVYEGAGWHKVGGNTLRYNRGFNYKSIAITMIGNFDGILPSPGQMDALKNFLKCGVEQGELAEDYRLLAHSQVSATISPGFAMYMELQSWPNWTELNKDD